jgi:hypothetical protein
MALWLRLILASDTWGRMAAASNRQAKAVFINSATGIKSFIGR